MKVAIGSKNPVKVNAARRAFSRAFPEKDIEAIGVDVSSGVSDMPLSFSEMVIGAKNRAGKAIEKEGADFGIGAEGGFEDEEMGTFLSGFVAILNKDGVWGYAQGSGLLMPRGFVERVKQENMELGHLIDEVTGEKNTKQKNGCVGLFTNNLISRNAAFEHTLIYALSRFLHPEFFEEKTG